MKKIKKAKYQKNRLSAVVICLLVAVVGTYLLVTSHAATATNCLAKPSNCGYPDATNTGVPAGTSLTASGSITVSTPGTVISGKDVSGNIEVDANNVTIKNTRITGGNFLVHVPDGITGTVVQNVEIRGQAAADSICILSNEGNIILDKVNISGCEDGTRLNPYMIVKNSYIHDLAASSVDPHYDGMQATYGSTATLTPTQKQTYPHMAWVYHNTIITRDNADVFLKTDQGPINDVLIEDNLLNGTPNNTLHYMLLLGDGGYGNPTNVQAKNNRFGRNYYYGPAAFNGASVTACGNVWDDNNSLLTSGNMDTANPACSDGSSNSGSSGGGGSTIGGGGASPSPSSKLAGSSSGTGKSTGQTSNNTQTSTQNANNNGSTSSTAQKQSNASSSNPASSLSSSETENQSKTVQKENNKQKLLVEIISATIVISALFLGRHKLANMLRR